ncbi:DUF4274 domain-containing protein [Deinococcus fonticola]|uniref:DUF4274 domain-containing protein n=1 Tax=Deinococcus fonticola TaxID=2528713 RepID=UPI001074B0ED|nr:DUF4274 domain-containing protein [Deinococcus fonticola]
MTYLYSPHQGEWLQWELLDLFLSRRWKEREVYDLAFVLHSNYDFNERQVEHYVDSADTPRSVALALYWMLQPDSWREAGEGLEDTDGLARFWELHRNYLENRYAPSTIAFDPVGYFTKQFEVFEVPEDIPALFLEPTEGRAVDFDALPIGNDGLPLEVWNVTQILWRLDEVADSAESFEVTSKAFRDLALKAHAEGLFSDLSIEVPSQLWLGPNPRPLFPEWRVLPEGIWQHLSLLPVMSQRDFEGSGT